jgi:hypothetical protein
MKSTEKYVEIMESLAGISVGATVTFEEATYEVSAISTDDLEATVTLTTEAEDKEDIAIALKDLVESEAHVITAKVDESAEDGEIDEGCKKKMKEEEEDDDMDDDDKSDDDKSDDEDGDMDDDDKEDDKDKKED